MNIPSNSMRNFVRVLAAAAVLSMTICASAQAGVVIGDSSSASGTGSTLTIPNVATSGADRLLSVGISTTEAATVTGVSYGGTALTSREAAAGHGVRAELWTLSAPTVGTATVTVTLSRSAPAVIGATSFTGVDPIDPILLSTGSADMDGNNSVGHSLNNTTVQNALIGVLALDNIANTSDVHVGTSTDLVTPDLRWNATANLHGAGATRLGNTGANQATSVAIDWMWHNDASVQNDHSDVIAALRPSSGSAAPSVAGPVIAAVAPTSATLGGDVTSDGGAPLSERGVVFCPGACTPVIGGPGTIKIATAIATTGSFTVPATGLAEGTSYTVRAYATNNVGTSYSASGTLTTTVANKAPTASAGGPYAIDEGSSLALSAAGSSDPDGDALTYSWDVNGDGNYGDATGVSPTLTQAQLAALGLDGPAAADVRVQVTDPTHAAVTSAAASLTVANVAPTATLGNDGPVVEGSDATISFTGPSDPSDADTAAGFHYAFDLDGDGTYDVGDGTYAKSGSAASVKLPTDDDGTYTVGAAIIDRDGGITRSTTTVSVTNAAPTATLRNDGPVVEGVDATVSFIDSSDPSDADTRAGFHYAFDLDNDGKYDVGDGTYAGSGTSLSATLPTDDDGTTTVGAAIIDRDGGITRYTTDVVVTNAPPTVAVTGPTSTPLGTSLPFAFAATDPSSKDQAGTFTYVIDWGDGQTDTVTGPAQTTAPHTYAAGGDFTISVVATDKDAGQSTAAGRLSVTIPAPPAPPAPTPTPDTTPAPVVSAPVTGASTPATVRIAHITSLSVLPRCVRGSAATARSVTIRYKLDIAAKVRVSLQRSKGSHAVSACPPAHGVKQDDGHLKPGTYASVTDKQITAGGSGSLVIAKANAHGTVGTAAAARVRPTALIAKGQRLQPGTYLLTLTTLDAAGHAQATSRVKFWVLKG